MEEYEEMVSILSEADVDAVELNLSCPNVKEGCLVFGSSVSGIAGGFKGQKTLQKAPYRETHTKRHRHLRNRMRRRAAGPCRILINTLLGMAIDAKTRRPVWAM